MAEYLDVLIPKLKEWEGVGEGSVEGVRHIAYLDELASPKHPNYDHAAGGLWTIGYGATGPEVKSGTRWTQEQADADLAKRAESINKSVDKLVTVDLNPNQRAAVVSLIYNVGEGAFAGSNALKELNAGNMDGFIYEAYDPDNGFTKAGGQKVKGLVNRRANERSLFTSPYSAPVAPAGEPLEVPKDVPVESAIEVPTERPEAPPTDRVEMRDEIPGVQLRVPEQAPQPVPYEGEPYAPPAPTLTPPTTELRIPDQPNVSPTYDELYTAQVAAKKEARDISWGDLMIAGVKNDNSLGIYASNLDYAYAPDFDFDIKKAQTQYKDRIDKLGGDQEEVGERLGRSVSLEHFEANLARLEEIQADEEMFMKAGAKGFVARLPGMMLDPVDLTAAAIAGPVGGAGKLRAAIQAATAAGVSNATIEAYAALNNPYRGGQDVAIAGLSGLFLGGAVGALTAKSLRRIRAEAERALDENVEDALRLGLAKELADQGNLSAAKRVLGTDAKQVDEPLAPTAKDTAEEKVAALPDQRFGWKWINTLQRNLIGRTFFSENETIRKVAAAVMEGGLLKDKGATRSLTAEGRANNLTQVATTRMFRSTQDDFVKWSERQGIGTLKREVGLDANEQFYGEVGAALRGKDASPEAKSAAAKVRPLLEEYHKMARDAGLPGFDGDPIDNFFPRYWDDAKLTKLSEEVSRETQGLWFKEALLKQWDEVEPRIDTTVLRDDLAAERMPLGDRLAEAEAKLQDAAEKEAVATTHFQTFSPRQKGIGEARSKVTAAKRESMAAKQEVRAAEKELKQFDETAELRINQAEADVPKSLLDEMEELRNRVEGLREQGGSRLREAQQDLFDVEARVNKILKRGSTREETAERIGQAFARAIHRRNLGINDAMQHGIPLDEADRLNELFDGTGLSKAEIDEFAERLRALSDNKRKDAGNVKHGKGRLRFDETLEVEVATRAGGKRMLSIEDMTISDASKALPRYFRTMSGWIGLAKEAGIRGQGDIDKILLNAAETGAKKDELDALRDSFKLVTGRSIEEDPSGLGSRASRLFTAWNYPRFGGSFGVAQLPEIGNIVGEVGVAAFIREIPDFHKLLKQAADGTLDDLSAREIDEIIGAGTDFINRRPHRNGGLIEDGVAINGRAAEALDAGAARAGRLTAITSLMSPINAVLERVATRAIMRDWGRIAQGTKKLSEAKKARLRNAGLSDEMQERVFAQLRDKASYKDGVLEVAQPHLWDDIEAADAYRMALDRERRMTIQRNEIGNTGSYIHKPVGRILTQFMNFMLNSINKQLVRGIHFRDIQTFTSWSTSMFLGGLAYTAQTSIDYANDPEKRKERLDPKRIAAASYQRAGFSAITVPVFDSVMTLAGQDPVFKFGRTSGLGTDFVTGNPTFSTATDLLYTATLPLRLALNDDYSFSQQDTQRIQRLIPLQRTLGIKNAFHAIESGLPARPSE